MKLYALIIALVIIAASALGGELPKNFVRAIHMQETSGKTGVIKGDNGRALGPLQIHRVYWQDATEFDKTIGGTYQDCANLQYSTRVMTAYLNRYAKRAVQQNDFETLARIHNGGPSGHKKAATVKYWQGVRRFL